MSTYSFKNKDGNIGIFQKENDTVHLYVDSEGYYEYYCCQQWSDWTSQASSDYNERFKGGDVTTPTQKSIEYYMLRFAESIDINVLDLYEIKNPGFFYPRISRGNFKFNYVNDSYHQDVRAYQSIQNSLDNLLYTIEPSKKNFHSYGQKVRELLILACTEVEYLLLRVLLENGYDEKKSYTTQDYIKCLPLLKLNEYTVVLEQYPNIETFKPFEKWAETKPTKSLRWYDAYNSVKHNRGGNLENANFQNLLDAIAAIHIIIEAQYGINVFKKFKQYADAKSVFRSTARPTWKTNEISAPLFSGDDLNAKWIGSLEYFSSEKRLL
tara:strand:+ start:67902 stop:68873 length:972 start_codon:yes stop_codon:yes gene_type:complete